MNRRMTETLARGFYGSFRIVLGAIFIYAAISKLGAPQEFADSIAAYHLVPGPIINVMALGLPLFELACGFFLLTGYFCATGLLSIIGLLVLFLAALLVAVVWLDANPWMALVRDGVLLAGAVYAYRHCLARELMARDSKDVRL